MTESIITHETRSEIVPATAAEKAAGGAGMVIVWGLADCRFGKCFIAQTPRGISHLSFHNGDETESLLAVTKDWPKAELQRDDLAAARMAWRAFSGSGDPIPVFVKGTCFQMKVWNALIGIRPGEISTYGRLAGEIGMPGGARAVGNAVGRNRISYLIPCHRVIRENGGSGGYRWGTDLKLAMLAAECPVTPR